NRFLEIAVYDRQPMLPHLSGQPLEYAILQIYSRDTGPREVRLDFGVGPGTQDLGFRGALDVLFEIRPAVRVRLGVEDADASPTRASFIISDGIERVPEAEKGPHGQLVPLDPRLGL